MAAKKDLLLLVGTAKGLFILSGDGRREWQVDGPHFAGRAVYSAFLDQRKRRNVMWAGPASWHFGAELVKSTDMGATWDEPENRRIKMPKVTKKSLENIWQIAAGGDDDSLYVGVAPAALFESHDQGSTWQLNKGLWSHPHRKQWQPGFGGLCLHTIVTDNKNSKDIKTERPSSFLCQIARGSGAALTECTFFSKSAHRSEEESKKTISRFYFKKNPNQVYNNSALEAQS